MILDKKFKYNLTEELPPSPPPGYRWVLKGEEVLDGDNYFYEKYFLTDTGYKTNYFAVCSGGIINTNYPEKFVYNGWIGIVRKIT